MEWYKKLIIAVAVLLACILFLFVGFKIHTVEVEGTQIYSAEEIEKSVFTRKLSDNMLFFSIYNKVFGINKLPFVEDIEISYEGTHTVKLHVYDKAISGCVRYMGQYVYFDKDGIVLQSMQEKQEGVPVVTGIKFGTFTMGEAFHVEDDSLFATIMNLSVSIAHYGMEVSQIHIADERVTLYAGDILVMLDRKERYEEEISALSSVLETAKREKLKGTIHMENYKEGDKIILKSTEKKKGKAKENQKER